MMTSCSLLKHSQVEAGAISHTGGLDWFPSKAENPLGTVVVVHGLNLKPSVMNLWIEVLNQAGLHALRVTLAGHDDNPALKFSGSARAWLENLAHACHTAQASYPAWPLFNLSFSLGALLSTVYADLHPGIFNRLVLLAPAIMPTRKLFFLRPMTWLRCFNASLPSLGLRKYLRYPSTPFSAYHGLIVLSDQARKLKHARELNQENTLLVLSTSDTLIDLSRTKAWLRNNQITAWRMLEITPQPKIKGSFNHMLLDPDGVGDRAWEILRQRVTQHLLRDVPFHPSSHDISSR